MLRFAIAAVFGALSLTACAQPAPPAAKAPAAAAKPGPAANAPADQAVRAALTALNPVSSGIHRCPGRSPVSGRWSFPFSCCTYPKTVERCSIRSFRTPVPRARPTAKAWSATVAICWPRPTTATASCLVRRMPSTPSACFTYIECGYCRKLHQDIAELNRNGISVEYLASPRMGLGSKDYTDMISVWCAADRRQALTNAKRGGYVPEKNCTNPVVMYFALGQQLGVNGTSVIFSPDGTHLGGYLPPAQLARALEKAVGQALIAADLQVGSRGRVSHPRLFSYFRPSLTALVSVPCASSPLNSQTNAPPRPWVFT
uniref:Thiol:disulfide interchange protein n=1 Tax=Stenotrophomonas maltophilia TaxID=40324 RepID=O68475_STEMA|nr:chitinase [Stenotrophomonas maltophilia]